MGHYDKTARVWVIVALHVATLGAVLLMGGQVSIGLEAIAQAVAVIAVGAYLYYLPYVNQTTIFIPVPVKPEGGVEEVIRGSLQLVPIALFFLSIFELPA